MQATHEGRTYQLVEMTDDMPHLRADMKRRGWDGAMYMGHSAPVGRQRTHRHGLFARTQQGEFKPLYA